MGFWFQWSINSPRQRRAFVDQYNGWTPDEARWHDAHLRQQRRERQWMARYGGGGGFSSFAQPVARYQVVPGPPSRVDVYHHCEQPPAANTGSQFTARPGPSAPHVQAPEYHPSQFLTFQEPQKALVPDTSLPPAKVSSTAASEPNKGTSPRVGFKPVPGGSTSETKPNGDIHTTFGSGVVVVRNAKGEVTGAGFSAQRILPVEKGFDPANQTSTYKTSEGIIVHDFGWEGRSNFTLVEQALPSQSGVIALSDKGTFTVYGDNLGVRRTKEGKVIAIGSYSGQRDERGEPVLDETYPHRLERDSQLGYTKYTTKGYEFTIIDRDNGTKEVTRFLGGGDRPHIRYVAENQALGGDGNMSRFGPSQQTQVQESLTTGLFAMNQAKKRNPSPRFTPGLDHQPTPTA